MHYYKLVRDKIPDIIRAKSGTPTTHIATDQEYWIKLKEKLLEETNEFLASESAEEIADILEVLEAIAVHKQLEWDSILELQRKKSADRGGFEKKIILDEA